MYSMTGETEEREERMERTVGQRGTVGSERPHMWGDIKVVIFLRRAVSSITSWRMDASAVIRHTFNANTYFTLC
jgi:hypothetical protein